MIVYKEQVPEGLLNVKGLEICLQGAQTIYSFNRCICLFHFISLCLGLGGMPPTNSNNGETQWMAAFSPFISFLNYLRYSPGRN